MKKYVSVLLVMALVAVAFWVGVRHGQRHSPSAASAGGRKILYYVDPMNPAHTSDRPGKAPCGMDMEPVYADTTLGTASGSELAALPAGTIQLSLEKQQL